MPYNYEIPPSKDITLTLKSDKLKVIEKRVLQYPDGEFPLAYKCRIGDKEAWIHYSIIDAIFNIEGDYDGDKRGR